MIVQAEFLRLQHPCGYCGTRIRDVLPLELSPVCDWFPTQAPALQSLFSSPSAVVQQSDFIKYFLSTPSNWCFLCCTRSNFRLVYMVCTSQAPLRREEVSNSLQLAKDIACTSRAPPRREGVKLALLHLLMSGAPSCTVLGRCSRAVSW